MLEIDGASQSGSGTIVRHAVALAALLGRPLHVVNARAGRKRPGLAAQHLAAVKACADLCDAKTEGLALGATEFTFLPARPPRGGEYAWDIGTAGSTTMLAFSVLPLAAFADRPFAARIAGGVFQDFAPSPHHLHHVLAPLLRRMGLSFQLTVVRPGYVPRGAGEIELRVQPLERDLRPLLLEERGAVKRVTGVALASHLKERRVSDRMADACERRLAQAGLTSRIERVDDSSAARPGACLAAWADTTTGCVLGADCAGALGRLSEDIGRRVADELLHDLDAGATVDRHAADMLVLFAALADGTSRYLVPEATEHVSTNLWIVGRVGARGECVDRQVTIQGIGHAKRQLSPGR